MSNNFNTVLIPPIAIADAAIRFAQDNFVDNHIGYCLGSDGHLPHITLAQVESIPPQDAKVLNKKISTLQGAFPEDIKLEDYYHFLDRGYCGLSVQKSNALQSLCDRISSIHSELGIEIRNEIGENYWPHMTFSKTEKQLQTPVIIPEILKNLSMGWRLEFGHMGDDGVYLVRYQS